MKPQSKYQAKVYRLSQQMRSLSKSELNWAFDKCFTHYAYRLKSGKAICMECGESLGRVSEDKHAVVCPHCQQHLKVKNTRNRLSKDKTYVSYMTTMSGFQVERVFMAYQDLQKGCKAKYAIEEVSQRWMNEKGKVTYIGLMRTLGYYLDSWSQSSTLEIRTSSLWIYDQIAISSYRYPRERVIPILTRNGYTERLEFGDKIALFKAILLKPQMETLLKAKQYHILAHFLKFGIEKVDKYWSSLRICMKRKYEIKDISMWCDLVDVLMYFDMDIKSPKYICPNDLRGEHDRLMGKKRNREEEIRNREREIMRAIEEEERKARKEDFYSLKGKFFGLNFSDGKIQVCVLESIEEFKNEGKKLHHCVYDNEYYAKPKSLILSARMDNEPIETIEVSLDTLDILQARGKFNQNSPYHEDIIRLVQNNIPLIAERLTA